MKLKDTERLEDLQCDGLKIIQDKNLYTFTSDSVILANFVKTRQNDVAVEIGAGCGVISILVQAKNKLQKIYAFEIQQCMQELCEKNIKLNNLQDKIFLIKDDAKNFREYQKNAFADVIFCNPPYFKVSNSIQNQAKKIAKEDEKLSCGDLAKTVSNMLKDGGTFFCCYHPERVQELFVELAKNKLFVKEMFFTENGKDKIKLVVFKAVKGGNFGTKIFPNLVTNEKDGKYLEKLHTKYMKK